MKYLIVAPQYTNRSGGVMVLHDLCEALNKIGHTAAIIFLHNGNALEQNFEFVISNNAQLHKPGINFYKFKQDYSDELSEFLVDGITIYPDLIHKNPLNAMKTVRYILNFNNISFPEDYILSFSKAYYKKYNSVLYKVFENEYMNEENSAHWTNRTLNATYIGKGAAFGECHVIKNSILIERDWPKNKEQLRILLRQVKFFFSWDNVSQTNYDAIMCGCVPVLMSDYSASKSMVAQMEPGEFPKVSLVLNGENVSLDYCENDVMSSLEKMKRTMESYSQNWEKNVLSFANDCEGYFV